jgi:hypothetical protein
LGITSAYNGSILDNVALLEKKNNFPQKFEQNS